jgi:putative spermidine/putrescine transport system permease protein
MKTAIRILFIAAFIIPPLYLLIRTFAGIWAFPSLLPETWSFRAVAFLRDNRLPVLRSLASSATYSLGAVVLSFAISFAPARVLARRRFPGSDAAETLLLAPLLVPGAVYALGLFPLMLRSGLADSFAGVTLVLALASFPYMYRALRAGFSSFPAEYELTASMLGAGTFRLFFTVQFPQLLPAALSGATVVFLAAFTEYFLVFLVGGGLVPSFSGYLVPLIRASDWSVSSALVMVFLAVPLVLYAALESFLGRYYRRRNIETGVQL